MFGRSTHPTWNSASQQLRRHLILSGFWGGSITSYCGQLSSKYSNAVRWFNTRTTTGNYTASSRSGPFICSSLLPPATTDSSQPTTESSPTTNDSSAKTTDSPPIMDSSSLTKSSPFSLLLEPVICRIRAYQWRISSLSFSFCDWSDSIFRVMASISSTLSACVTENLFYFKHKFRKAVKMRKKKENRKKTKSKWYNSLPPYNAVSGQNGQILLISVLRQL